MHNAARVGDLERLKALLSERPEDSEQLKKSLEDNMIVNKKDEFGRKLLHYAALNNHIMIAEQLLSNEIQIPLKEEEAIVLSGSNPEDPFYSLCPGIYAVIRKFKIDISIQDVDGYTPLDLAVLNGHTEIVRNILIFMVREIKKLFVTPEDDEYYEVNEDEYVSITLEYQ